MSNRTGYYYAKGTLRHCHSASLGDGASEWHDASNVHPATPDAHNLFQCFSAELAAWSRANADLTPQHRALLIRESEIAHNEASAHRSQPQYIQTTFNISCPDCGVIFPGQLAYHGQGGWKFDFSCTNRACQNYRYQYTGTINER